MFLLMNPLTMKMMMIRVDNEQFLQLLQRGLRLHDKRAFQCYLNCIYHRKESNTGQQEKRFRKDYHRRVCRRYLCETSKGCCELNLKEVSGSYCTESRCEAKTSTTFDCTTKQTEECTTTKTAIYRDVPLHFDEFLQNEKSTHLTHSVIVGAVGIIFIVIAIWAGIKYRLAKHDEADLKATGVQLL